MELPLVSIVVPTYNHGRYLRQCIDSILAQTYPRIELIVIDDGSSDDTLEILKLYGNRFYWESSANKGQSAALNKGWELSSGEILGYVSSDDYLHPEALACCVHALISTKEIIVTYPNFVIVDEESKVIRHVTLPQYSSKTLLMRFTGAPGPGAVFLRSAWDMAGPWNPIYRQSPDLDFWVRMALIGNFLRVPRDLAFYRHHSGSQSSNPVDIFRAEESRAIARGLFKRDDIPAWLALHKKEVMANSEILSANAHLRSKRVRQALNCLQRGIGFSPSLLWSRWAFHQLLHGAFGHFCDRARKQLNLQWLSKKP